MKQFLKKIIKKLIPQRILQIIKNIESIDSLNIKLNKFEQVQLKRIQINTELLFSYVAGFSGRVAEREILNSYQDAPADHILRYKLFANEIKEGDKVLDAACGVGYGTAYLNDFTEASSIIGGDIDPNVVNFCKKIFGHPTYVWKKNTVSFQQLDIADTSAFTENSFDKICSFETLEHVPHEVAEKAFKNLYDWLKEGGICYCSVPNNDIYPFKRYQWSPYHFRHYSPQEFYDTLQQAGFKKIDLKYYNPQGELLDKITPECFGTIIAICEK
ncbi:MAG: methyltransferase domain-containing protein [Brevinema sp.]